MEKSLSNNNYSNSPLDAVDSAYTVDYRNLDVATMTPLEQQLLTGYAYQEGRALGEHYAALFVATAIEKQRAEAHYTATHDALTGLLNLQGLKEAIAEIGPDMVNFGVLTFDGTNFKAVNDTLGHGRGNELLEQLGQLFTRIRRSGDVVARLGGDEFIMLVQGTPNVEAAEPKEELTDRRKKPSLPIQVVGALGRFRAEVEKLLEQNPDIKALGFEMAFAATLGKVDTNPEILWKAAEAALTINKAAQHAELGQHRPPKPRTGHAS